MSMIARFVCCLFIFGLQEAADAHEVRPAYLEIVEHANGVVDIHWRQPVTGDATIAIAPEIDAGWLDADPLEQYVTVDALHKRWSVTPPHADLAGQTIRIRGLERTITDTFVRIVYADGSERTRLIKAAHPTSVIPDPAGAEIAMPQYLLLGITHIWSGADHLLYVLGLVLLISGMRTLVVTITAFTIAHSITLACAALGLVQLRPAPVEAVIALSILYVAVELVRARRGQSGLASRAPWTVAFAFGLLHGFGFAGALQAIGLPESAVAGALLLFNIGIELGQLVFVAAVLLVSGLLRRLAPAIRKQAVTLAPWGIGSAASYWLLSRLATVL